MNMNSSSFLVTHIMLNRISSIKTFKFSLLIFFTWNTPVAPHRSIFSQSTLTINPSSKHRMMLFHVVPELTYVDKSSRMEVQRRGNIKNCFSFYGRKKLELIFNWVKFFTEKTCIDGASSASLKMFHTVRMFCRSR